MLDTVFGLPVHPLLVHATVITVPMAAVTVPMAALWPRFRRWAGPGPLLLALAALVLDPLSTKTGEYLEHRVPYTDAIGEHEYLAEKLLPWLIGLALLAAAGYALHLRDQRSGAAGRPDSRALSRTAGLARPVALGLAALSLVAAAGTIVRVAQIGHSGAKAAWSDAGKADPAAWVPPARD